MPFTFDKRSRWDTRDLSKDRRPQKKKHHTPDYKRTSRVERTNEGKRLFRESLARIDSVVEVETMKEGVFQGKSVGTVTERRSLYFGLSGKTVFYRNLLAITVIGGPKRVPKPEERAE